MLDCCRPLDAESNEEAQDFNQSPGPGKGPGPSVVPSPVAQPGPSGASGPVSGPGPCMVPPGAVSAPWRTEEPQVSEDTLLQSKVEVQIESASDDWVRTYAQQGWHIIAVHALHDPASVQVGREHPGLHPQIMESALDNPLFQRYMYSTCT